MPFALVLFFCFFRSLYLTFVNKAFASYWVAAEKEGKKKKKKLMKNWLLESHRRRRREREGPKLVWRASPIVITFSGQHRPAQNCYPLRQRCRWSEATVPPVQEVFPRSHSHDGTSGMSSLRGSSTVLCSGPYQNPQTGAFLACWQFSRVRPIPKCGRRMIVAL